MAGFRKSRTIFELRMTMDLYEQKYKEALERAKHVHTTNVDENKKSTEYIFPELKESESERIRKELITHFRNTRCTTEEGAEKISKWIAWLEKQEEKPVEEYNITGISSGHATGKLREIIKDIESEKVEAKFKVGDEIKTGNEESLTITKIDEKGYWSEDLFICSFEDSAKWELVGRLVDKIEPKFHEGDWIVRDGKTLQISHIDKVLDGTFHYWFTKGTWLSSAKMEDARLWNIQDAKEGAVLAEDSCIFIIEKMNPNGTAIVHCTLFNDGEFHDGETLHFDIDSTHPATKEQRDLLFSKMKEAGYEWDAEKKEPKKIEPKELDPDKVIEWIHKYWPFSWGNFTLQVDNAIDKFKKDFGL